MQRRFWICASLVFAVGQCVAQGPCQAKPGAVTVNIPLVENSMEPTCQPSRIRVSDRTAVTLMVTNVSPIEVCVASAKPPTVTTVVNPLESIINTITGYKSFDFANSKPLYDAQVAEVSKVRIAPAPAAGKKVEEPPPDPALTLFNKLAGEAFDEATKIAKKQEDWKKVYTKDTDDLTVYVMKNYRANHWSEFNPDDPSELKTVKAHADFNTISMKEPQDKNPPSEIDLAPLQAYIDQLKALQPRLITLCTTTTADKFTCDATKLSKTSQVIEQVTAIQTVLTDNFKYLQTAQAALVTSLAVLHKMQVDFGLRLNSKNVVKQPANPNNWDKLKDDEKTKFRATQILIQQIHLGTDYGATDPGTVSCSTDSTPAVATTDSINYAILYQNVPALTVSAGLLISFLEKDQWGVSQLLDNTKTPPVLSTAFVITDSARASVVPMAYINYRVAPPILKTWWGQPNSELVVSHNISAGIGINSNTGTNQPEFFAGYAIGFSRSLIHAGLDYGRQESLGGGFLKGTVPTGFTGTTAPINWNYKPAFSIGLSVRIAPF
jgi:hypothetical protein